MNLLFNSAVILKKVGHSKYIVIHNNGQNIMSVCLCAIDIERTWLEDVFEHENPYVNEG